MPAANTVRHPCTHTRIHTTTQRAWSTTQATRTHNGLTCQGINTYKPVGIRARHAMYTRIHTHTTKTQMGYNYIHVPGRTTPQTALRQPNTHNNTHTSHIPTSAIHVRGTCTHPGMRTWGGIHARIHTHAATQYTHTNSYQPAHQTSKGDHTHHRTHSIRPPYRKCNTAPRLVGLHTNLRGGGHKQVSMHNCTH